MGESREFRKCAAERNARNARGQLARSPADAGGSLHFGIEGFDLTGATMHEQGRPRTYLGPLADRPPREQPIGRAELIRHASLPILKKSRRPKGDRWS